MKILVTGSSGMLGTELVEVLRGHFDVFGLTRHPASSDQINTIILDLTNRQALENKLLEIKPDIVIHAAAFTKVDLCEDEKWAEEARRQNTTVVENLIDICNATNSFLIFFSTDYVFSGKKKEPYLESDLIEPINYYGQTKAWAEKSIQERSKRFIIFRITWLYGKRGQHFPAAILRQAREKKELSIVNDQWGRPTWTRDVAEVILKLLTSRKKLLDQYNKEIFHIGNSGTINWSGFARQILDQSGFANVKIKEISAEELKRPAARPKNSVLNLDRARQLLEIEMRSWQDAVNEFLKEKAE